MPTEAEIEAARTAKGGWTKDQLAQWGVSWPPSKGWKKLLAEMTAPAMSLAAYDEQGNVVFMVPLGPDEIERLAKIMDLGDRKGCYPLMARLSEKMTLFVEASTIPSGT